MEYCLIAGPIVMSNDDALDEDISMEPEKLAELPRMTTAQVRALSEVLCSAVHSVLPICFRRMWIPVIRQHFCR